MKHEFDGYRAEYVGCYLNKQQIEAIEALYSTGFWGNSSSETVGRLIDFAIRDLIGEVNVARVTLNNWRIRGELAATADVEVEDASNPR